MFQVDTSNLLNALRSETSGTIRVFLDDSGDADTTFHIEGNTGFTLDQSGDILLQFGSDVTITVTATATTGATNFHITDADYSFDQSFNVYVWQISSISFDAGTKHIGDSVTLTATYDDGGANLDYVLYLRTTNGLHHVDLGELSGGSIGPVTLLTFNDSTALYPDSLFLSIFFISFDNNYELSPPSLALLIGIPQAPSEMVATPASSSQINLTWIDNSSGGFEETQFDLLRADDSGFTINISTTHPAADATSASITGLSAGKQYYFMVRATNSSGSSIYSSSANATTKSAALGGSAMFPAVAAAAGF